MTNRISDHWAVLTQVASSHAADILSALDLLVTELKNTENSLNKSYYQMARQGDYDYARRIVGASEALNAYAAQITGFLSENQLTIDNIESEEVEEEPETGPTGAPIDYDSYNVDNSVAYDLYTPLTFKRPYAVSFKGKKQLVNQHKLLYLHICEELYAADPAKFQGFVTDTELKGRGMYWVSRNSSDFRSPREVKDSGLFIETNLAANDIRKRLLKMLDRYNITSDAVQIYFRRDYTPLH